MDSKKKKTTWSFVEKEYLFNIYQVFQKCTIFFDFRDKHSLEKFCLPNTIWINPNSLQKSVDRSDDIASTLETQYELNLLSNRKRSFVFLIPFENQEIVQIFREKYFPDRETLLDKPWFDDILKLENASDEVSEFDSFFSLLEEKNIDKKEIEKIRIAISVYKIFSEEKVKEVFILLETVETFMKKYAFLNTRETKYEGKAYSN